MIGLVAEGHTASAALWPVHLGGLMQRACAPVDARSMPAAVQFVLADTVPRASYIVPTQQLVLATYGAPRTAVVGRRVQAARIGKRPLLLCGNCTGIDRLQGRTERAAPRQHSCPLVPPSAGFLFLMALESITVFHIVMRHQKREEAEVSGAWPRCRRRGWARCRPASCCSRSSSTASVHDRAHYTASHVGPGH